MEETLPEQEACQENARLVVESCECDESGITDGRGDSVADGSVLRNRQTTVNHIDGLFPNDVPPLLSICGGKAPEKEELLVMKTPVSSDIGIRNTHTRNTESCSLIEIARRAIGQIRPQQSLSILSVHFEGTSDECC